MLIVKKDLVNIEFWIERVATCILNIYRISGIFHRDLFFLRDQINIMLYPILFAIRKYWIAKHDRRKLKKEKYFPKFRKYCNTRKKPSDIRYVVFTKLHHKLHCSNTPNSRLSRDHNYSWTNQRSSWFFFSVTSAVVTKECKSLQEGQWPRLKNKYIQQSGEKSSILLAIPNRKTQLSLFARNIEINIVALFKYLTGD